MEQIILTSPVTQLHISKVIYDWDNSLIEVVSASSDNTNFVHCFYTGQVAHDLMLAINKADCSVKSQHRRILERLIADGKLAGTISGVPD